MTSNEATYTASSVTRMGAAVLLIGLLITAILWKVEANEDVNQNSTLAAARKENHALRKRVEQANRERWAYQSAAGIAEIEAIWYKEAYLKKCRELEDEKAISVKATRDILEKQKAVLKLQKEVFDETTKPTDETETNNQQSSRGEQRSVQLGENDYLGESFSGQASWYGEGQATASGERFNPGELTAAHRNLKFGSKVEVTNKSTGKSVVVRINDRGPAKWTGRVIDLSQRAFSEIAPLSAGVCQVTYEVIK